MIYKDDNEARQAGALPPDPEEGASETAASEASRLIASNLHRHPPEVVRLVAQWATAQPGDLAAAALGKATQLATTAAAQASDPSACRRYGVRSMAELLGGVYHYASQEKPERGVPTGNDEIDNLIGGYRRGHVSVVGASTNWGKSSFAVMACDAAERAGKRVLLVSGEDKEGIYGRRIMAKRARVNAMALRDCRVHSGDLSRMVNAVAEASTEPFFLDGIGKTAEYLAAAITEICAEYEKDLVIVDYLQAFTCSKRCQDRRNEITHIARVFTDVIKRANAAGLIFSQLKRLDDNKRPTKHDLKESGDVENMAEHVLIGWYTKTGDGLVRRYISIDKNKDGPCLDEAIELQFDTVTASFREQGTVRVYGGNGDEARYN